MFDAFIIQEPVKLLQGRSAVLVARCSKDKMCSGILDFLHWLHNRVKRHDKSIGII